MSPAEEAVTDFSPEDHQVAYIWEAAGEDEARRERPSKRHKVSKKNRNRDSGSLEKETIFVPLLNGAERPEFVRLRQQLFEESWAQIDGRIQEIVRDANSSTLDQVLAFVTDASTQCRDQIKSAFIITGPNIASQDLLFEQLSETLPRSSTGKLVRLRSSEVKTLKAVLKKTIRDSVSQDAAGDDELEVKPGQGVRVLWPDLPPPLTLAQGRRYLDYDLEALEAALQPQECKQIIVAFQDSEGFDSGLLSDLISLFHSWWPRISFTLVFGIATSVELLQARLLKSACRLVHGAQFDCVQTATILERVFKGAVAANDAPLQLGASLLQTMLDRQHEHMAGIRAFISSLKYAYMCHFYANPLSIFLAPDGLADMALQAEHTEALRNLDSFRRHVERAVEMGSQESIAHARLLLENDDYLVSRAREIGRKRREWTGRMLRSILVLEAVGEQSPSFLEVYARVVAEEAELGGSDEIADRIRRLGADELSVFLAHVIGLLKDGEASLKLPPSTEEADQELVRALEGQLDGLNGLRGEAESGALSLQSRCNGQSKVMRTTVIAQRVQLSHDLAALRDEDRRLTEFVDEATRLLTAWWAGGRRSRPGPGPESEPEPISEREPKRAMFSECWVYDSRWPLRQVFVPRPRTVFERSLGRPQDYLCGETGMQATAPATCVLYQLYLETGSLVNAADLWKAFQALTDETEDERSQLTQFYRGLAELRALGFVKASKRKADHVGKVKWL